MTRQIKLRAWDKKRKEWCRNIVGNCEYPSHITTLSIPENKNLDIQQFTGLLDRNGKEIWEGDIVKMYTPGNSSIPVEIKTAISFKEGSFIAVEMNRKTFLTLKDAITLSNDVKMGLEIVGNVYEHPELLK